MAGAVDKKIVEVKEELVDSPTTHLSARTGIIDAVTLIREFSETHLKALTEKFTSGSGSYTLSEVCENLARQRLICWGARNLQTTFRKFDLPAYETVNGALGVPTTIIPTKYGTTEGVGGKTLKDPNLQILEYEKRLD